MRRSRRLRRLILAGLLAVVASLLVAGPVLADEWPSDAAHASLMV